MGNKKSAKGQSRFKPPWIPRHRSNVKEQIVGIFDIHLRPDEPLHPAWRVAKKFIYDIRPSRIVVGGDATDLNSISWHERSKPKLKEGKRYSKDAEIFKSQFSPMVDRLGKTDFIYIQGNHEERSVKLVEAQPELEGTLDWVVDSGSLDMGMEIVPFNAIYKTGKLSWTHGFWYPDLHAKKHLIEFGGSIAYGHTHNWQMYSRNIKATGQSIAAWGVACLTDIDPAYRKGIPTRHQHGLIVVDLFDDGFFAVHPVWIINDGTSHVLSWDGHLWKA